MKADKLKLFLLIPLAAALLVLSTLIQPQAPSARRGPEIVAGRQPDGTRDAGAVAAPTTNITTVALTLAGILVLAAGTILVVRRLQGGIDTVHDREIRIKETRRLSGKRLLHLVRASERLLLLAESEHGLSLLCDLTPDEHGLAAADLAELERAPVALGDDEDDDGAVPRDMVIPRPARRPAPARQARPAPAAKAAALPADFKKLLARLAARS
ncbi:MAG: flagellar biosynthetic protein FliO [Planctomycetota bacterium]